jgi:phosphate transport system permease protein
MILLDEPTGGGVAAPWVDARAVAAAPPGGDAEPERGSGRPQERRRIGGLRLSPFNLVGAAAAGTSGAVLLARLTALEGAFGMVVVGYVLFVVIYGALVSLTDDRPAVADAVMTVLMATCAVLAFGALAVVIGFTVARGWHAVVHVNFFTQDMSTAGPLAPLSKGGMAHALVGTLWMVGIAVVLTVPVGLVAALYLDMTRSRPSRLFRTVVEAMTALPSILAGLFIFSSWILLFGFGRSGLAAALALSVMMLPYIIRAADLSLRLVPGNLREAAAALGTPRWRTELQVVVPTARSGLATAIILGIARAIGEASPVLLTAGFTSYLNTNPFNGSMVSLPLESLKLVQTGVPTYITRAFACASLLLVVVITLFLIARRIGGWGPGHLSPRAARRADRESVRDRTRLARLATGARGVATATDTAAGRTGRSASDGSLGRRRGPPPCWLSPPPCSPAWSPSVDRQGPPRTCPSTGRAPRGRPARSTSGSPTCRPTACGSTTPPTGRRRAGWTGSTG